MGSADASATIETYYEALRSGEPLDPFFADDGPVVKVGIGERLVGAETVAAGLRRQSTETTDWTVVSRDLHVGTHGDGADRVAWFGDEVSMAWTDTGRRIRFEFDTRWTGAMLRRDGGWRFVTMHVSTPDSA